MPGGSILLATILNRRDAKSKKSKKAVEAFKEFKEFLLLMADATFHNFTDEQGLGQPDGEEGGLGRSNLHLHLG